MMYGRLTVNPIHAAWKRARTALDQAGLLLPESR